MKEELENPISKGNGSLNDGISHLADIMIEVDKKNDKVQKKNLIWLIVSTIISGLVLILTIFSILK